MVVSYVGVGLPGFPRVFKKSDVLPLCFQLLLNS